MKETIKVICYKSKTLSNGEHPIIMRDLNDYQQTEKNQTEMLNLNIY